MTDLCTKKDDEFFENLQTALQEIQEYLIDPDILEVYVNPDYKLWKISLNKGRIQKSS